MQWLKMFSDWLHAREERTRLARVEEELRIQRQLDYLEQQRAQSQVGKILTVSEPQLMGQGIVDLQRRC